MIRSVLLIMLIPSLALGKELIEPTIKSDANCKSIPNGAACYSSEDQKEILDRLTTIYDCQQTLEDCRKWRDKYKSLLSDQPFPVDGQEFAGSCEEQTIVHKWTKKTWLTFGIATIVATGLGIGIGASF